MGNSIGMMSGIALAMLCATSAFGETVLPPMDEPRSKAQQAPVSDTRGVAWPTHADRALLTVQRDHFGRIVPPADRDSSDEPALQHTDRMPTPAFPGPPDAIRL